MRKYEEKIVYAIFYQRKHYIHTYTLKKIVKNIQIYTLRCIERLVVFNVIQEKSIEFARKNKKKTIK